MACLKELKNYLRVDFDDDDELLKALVSSAQAYIKNTTGKKFSRLTPLYNLTVKLIVEHWYENRGVISEKSVNNLPYSVGELISHLSLCGAYE